MARLEADVPGRSTPLPSESSKLQLPILRPIEPNNNEMVFDLESLALLDHQISGADNNEADL